VAKPLRVQKGEGGYDVDITRSNNGPWGNPFIIGIHGTRAEVIAQYAEWLPRQPELMARLPELKGKVLGCACRADQKCHGNVLLNLLANLPDTNV
jgi:hypothetical protein